MRCLDQAFAEVMRAAALAGLFCQQWVVLVAGGTSPLPHWFIFMSLSISCQTKCYFCGFYDRLHHKNNGANSDCLIIL